MPRGKSTARKPKLDSKLGTLSAAPKAISKTHDNGLKDTSELRQHLSAEVRTLRFSPGLCLSSVS